MVGCPPTAGHCIKGTLFTRGLLYFKSTFLSFASSILCLSLSLSFVCDDLSTRGLDSSHQTFLFPEHRFSHKIPRAGYSTAYIGCSRKKHPFFQLFFVSRNNEEREKKGGGYASLSITFLRVVCFVPRVNEPNCFSSGDPHLVCVANRVRKLSQKKKKKKKKKTHTHTQKCILS